MCSSILLLVAILVKYFFSSILFYLTANSRSRTQTFDLGMMRHVFYHLLLMAILVKYTFSSIFFNLTSNSSNKTQTIGLGMIRQVFYHFTADSNLGSISFCVIFFYPTVNGSSRTQALDHEMKASGRPLYCLGLSWLKILMCIFRNFFNLVRYFPFLI
jgi:hypothetical protein